MAKMFFLLKQGLVFLKRKIAEKLASLMASLPEESLPGSQLQDEEDISQADSLSLLLPLLNMSMSYDKIIRATNNFGAPVITSSGGSWSLYEGTLDNGAKVAVKRLLTGNPDEFRAELTVFSQVLHHPNIVSLIAFCNEMYDKILVLEFMERETLACHLDKISGQCNLSWERRLQICIDTAAALHHLHTGFSSSRIIHGDVTSLNIFLDENYTAKVANFGASQSIPFVDDADDHDTDGESSNSISSLDFDLGSKQVSVPSVDDESILRPYEIIASESSKNINVPKNEKFDVYSYGIVLLEVLCGRREIIEPIPQGFAGFWNSFGSYSPGRQYRWLEKRSVKSIVDPVLVGEMNPSSLRAFSATVEKCLRSDENERPVMREVLWDLEMALELQRTGTPSEWHKDLIINGFPELKLEDVLLAI